MSDETMQGGPEMFSALRGFGGFLRCEQCGHTAPLGDPAARTVGRDGGWPKHCGYTMRWWTQRQIDAGEHRVAS